MKSTNIHKRMRWTLAMVAVLVLTILLSVGVMELMMYKQLQENTERETSRMELFLEQEIGSFASKFTTFVSNHIDCLYDTVRVYDMCKEMVDANEYTVEMAAEYRPNFFPDKELYMPCYYRYRADEGAMDAAKDTRYTFHNYPETDEAYRACTQTHRSHWTAPYIEPREYDGNILMDYARPIFDTNGEVFVVVVATSYMKLWQEQLSQFEMYENGKFQLWSTMDSIDILGELPPDWDEDNVLPHFSEKTTAFLTEIQKTQSHGSRIDLKGADKMFYASYIPKLKCVAVYSFPIANVIGAEYKTSILVLLIVLIGGGLAFWLFKQQSKETAKQMMEEQALAQDMAAASAIQHQLLPAQHTRVEMEGHEVKIDARLISAKDVGGDLYVYKRIEQYLYFAIGDVSGKGIPAAIMMAKATSLFYTLMRKDMVPSEIVSLMNKEICHGNEEMMFVTLFVGQLDFHTGKLTYCNAAHNAPVIWDGTKSTLLPIKHHIPAGLKADYTFEDEELQLKSGDRLLVYTDGVTEAKNPERKQYGEERLLTLCDKHYGHEHDSVIDTLIEDVKSFAGAAEQSDDLTLLELRV